MNKIEEICGNCKLFNRKNFTCRIAVLYAGEEYHIPVDPNESCFFENKFESIKEELIDDKIVRTKEKFSPIEEVKQVRFWTEDEDGNPTEGNGRVKIEYPEGFFGDG